jgi:hypothetical protein
MTLNQTQISVTTLTSTVAYVDIPVPSGYSDIKLVFSARDTRTGTNYTDDVYALFNGDSGANYQNQIIYGGNGGVGSFTGSTGGIQCGYCTGNDGTALVFGNSELYIYDYASTSNYKVTSTEGMAEANSTNGVYLEIANGVWKSNAAITTIRVLPANGSFVAGSSFSLYGISKLGVTPTVYPKATGGDIIKNDGTYWYHAFLSTGKFIPQQSLNADILVVAGGGGGGCDIGGGGGAGGVYAFSSQSLTSTPYNCTIGAGGTGSSSVGIAGIQGGNSQFGSLTASIGGGYGGGYSSGDGTGGNGGSGGGNAYIQTVNQSTAVSGQGNIGGRGNSGGSAGGGGGAGGAGVSTTSGAASGAGGAGVASYTGWGSLSAALTTTGLGVSGYIAGGGGGGGYNPNTATGQAGGGNGGAYSPTTAGGNATINTGSGGGGGSAYSGVGGKGGSGIIIVRYAMA